MSSRKKQIDRRTFLKRVMLGSVAVTAYQYSGNSNLLGTATQAFSGTRPQRRHLINIIKGGGFDAYWFHSSFCAEQLASSVHPGLEAGVGDASGTGELQKQKADTGALDYLNIREPFNSAHYYTDQTTSKNRRHYFGSAFQHLFRNTKFDNGSELLSKMQIWKGVDSPCRHEDNAILNQGVNSPYALSFSALIADRIANDFKRTLHYTVLHASPGEAFLNFAMNKGWAAPTCIPGVSGLSNLTSVDANDFQEVSRRDLISSAVAKLSGPILTSRLKLKNSIANIAGFAQFNDASRLVAGSKMDQDIEFLYLQNRFRENIYRQICSYFGIGSSGLDSAANPASTYLYNVIDQIDSANANVPNTVWMQNHNMISDLRAHLNYVISNPLPDITAYRTKKAAGTLTATEEQTLRNQLNSNVANLGNQSPALMDKFTLAAYFVRQNLSSVVDFREGQGSDVYDDAHHNSIPSFVRALVFFAGYQQLMLCLDEIKEVNPGETLLDATHIVMHTEMDRTAWVANNRFLDGGTNHSDHTTSFLMAGFGITGGRIIGDLHRGINDAPNFPGMPFTSSLPLDTREGQPLPGGRKVTYKSLAPTMVEMFSQKLPDNQISDEGFFEPVINRNKKMTT